MTSLLELRDKLNLTQEEVAKKAGLSIRTVQRIEAGTPPKGHTLDALSKALEVDREYFQMTDPTNHSNHSLIKYINLSSILFIFLPPGNILLPLCIMIWKKEMSPVAKQILSLQIVWTISSVLLVILSSFLKHLLSIDNQITSFTLLALLILNLYIILRNTVQIDRSGTLKIKLNFSLL